MNKEKYPNLESEKNYQNNLYIEVDTSEGLYSGESLKEIIDEINNDHNGSCVKATAIICYFSRDSQKVLSDKHLQIFNKFLAAKLEEKAEEDQKESWEDNGFELARKDLQDQLL